MCLISTREEQAMSYDALTYSAVTIVVVYIFVMILVSRSKENTDRKLRSLARQLSLMQYNEDVRELCEKIRKTHPELCPGIDFTLKEKDGKAEIDEWHSSKPRP
jgi:signal transduction histidine kinase